MRSADVWKLVRIERIVVALALASAPRARKEGRLMAAPTTELREVFPRGFAVSSEKRQASVP